MGSNMLTALNAIDVAKSHIHRRAEQPWAPVLLLSLTGVSISATAQIQSAVSPDGLRGQRSDTTRPDVTLRGRTEEEKILSGNVTTDVTKKYES